MIGTAFLIGCAATVSCPPAGDDPTTVFLLDHGRHTSLVLPTGDGMAVRYSYGDRRWYALGDTSLRSGFNALFRDTPGVLMRIELRTAPTLEAVVRAVGVETESAFALTVRATHVGALASRLDALHGAGTGNPDARFAPHPEAYTMANNSNHVVAEWLGDLGCDTRGSPLTSNWRLAD